jgi:hypothetical protein
VRIFMETYEWRLLLICALYIFVVTTVINLTGY